jgi:hypothetical protein
MALNPWSDDTDSWSENRGLPDTGCAIRSRTSRCGSLEVRTRALVEWPLSASASSPNLGAQPALDDQPDRRPETLVAEQGSCIRAIALLDDTAGSSRPFDCASGQGVGSGWPGHRGEGPAPSRPTPMRRTAAPPGAAAARRFRPRLRRAGVGRSGWRNAPPRWTNIREPQILGYRRAEMRRRRGPRCGNPIGGGPGYRP